MEQERGSHHRNGAWCGKESQGVNGFSAAVTKLVMAHTLRKSTVLCEVNVFCDV